MPSLGKCSKNYFPKYFKGIRREIIKAILSLIFTRCKKGVRFLEYFYYFSVLYAPNLKMWPIFIKHAISVSFCGITHLIILLWIKLNFARSNFAISRFLDFFFTKTGEILKVNPREIFEFAFSTENTVVTWRSHAKNFGKKTCAYVHDINNWCTT